MSKEVIVKLTSDRIKVKGGEYVQDLVRCKECKHWSDGVAGCTDHVKCCKIGFYMVGENGYCVYGERRSDNERKAD